MLDLAMLRSEALEILGSSEDGDPLDPLSRALIELAVRVSVTSLNRDAIRAGLASARGAGASSEQIHEIMALISGLGVHSLMVAAPLVEDRPPILEAMDSERQALWTRYVGDDPYWAVFDREMPGFLLALLALSPASFEGFFEYCGIAWATRSVKAVVKELAAMACDATPQHRFGPGFRLHAINAVKLGAGRLALLEALDIAEAAPLHQGVY